MKRPFQLSHHRISTDTVDALHELLAEAKAGEVIGVALVAMRRNREFLVATAGEAHRSPTFARGMVAYLDDSLGDMARQR